MTDAPALFDQALAHLVAAAKDRGLDVLPLVNSFAALQPLVTHVPRGPLAVGLAAMWAARAARDHGAFWFPQREAPLGAALGLPDALVALGPIDLVEAALHKGVLSDLDDRERELRDSLANARAHGAVAEEKLGAADYRALFDPAFVYFLAVDEARVREALALSTAAARDALRDAIATIPDPLKRDALEAVWRGPLTRLDGALPLGDHARREPRAIEAFIRLYAAVAHGGAADEAFWDDVVLAGAAQSIAASGTSDESRVLGVFRTAGARPAVTALGARARFYVVDANDLPLALALADTSEGRALSPELRAIATKRIDELAKLRTRGALAFRRLTEAELPHEALAATVSTALRG